MIAMKATAPKMRVAGAARQVTKSTQRTTHQPDDRHNHGGDREHRPRGDIEQTQTDNARK